MNTVFSFMGVALMFIIAFVCGIVATMVAMLRFVKRVNPERLQDFAEVLEEFVEKIENEENNAATEENAFEEAEA